MDAAQYYDNLASRYWQDAPLEVQAYHRMRVDAFLALLEEARLPSEALIFDFGCGTGEVFGLLSTTDYRFSGCDISAEMVKSSQKVLAESGRSTDAVVQGGVDVLQDQWQRFDAIIALNVLPYLSVDDEAAFFRHATSALKPDGVVIISHTNELLDITSFNRYTVEFYQDRMCRYLDLEPGLHRHVQEQLPRLLAEPDLPHRPDLASSPTLNWSAGKGQNPSERDFIKKRRVDPFVYPEQIAKAHPQLVLQSMLPINVFPVPPKIVESMPALVMAQLGAYKSNMPEHLRKLLCSQFQASFRKRVD